MNQRIRYRWSPVVLVFVSLLVGCGKPFNVQPRPKVLPANYKVSAESGGITIDAEPVTDEDKLYDTFEANLLLASVLPVRLRLTNTQAEGLEIKDARFTIKSQNQTFKRIDAKSAYKRLMKYYRISIYNKAGYKASREDFTAYEIALKDRLKANESREGLMFFAIPGEFVNSSDVSLIVEKLGAKSTKTGQSVELKIK